MEQDTIAMLAIIIILIIDYATSGYQAMVLSEENAELKMLLNTSESLSCSEKCLYGYSYASMMLDNYEFVANNESIKLELSLDSIDYCIDICEENLE